jgi:hypothetical protein
MSTRITIVLFVSFLISTSFAADSRDHRHRKSPKKQIELRIVVTPAGPTQEAVDSARSRIEQNEAFQKELSGKKYRFFSIEYVENGTPAPTLVKAVYYDYSADMAVVAVASLDGSVPVSIHREYFQPVPNDDEMAEAEKVIESDAALGNSLKSGAVAGFRPMPPVTVLSGTTERLVNVGLRSSNSGKTEIVSVSIARGLVVRYPSGAPTAAVSTVDACGIVDANQPRTPVGTQGSANLTVRDGSNNVVWEMLVIRPSISSGTNGSGIELQNIKYKGKSVLKRAHVPILDVQYQDNVCGPYRDWQFDEGMFQAPDTGAIDYAPGIRVLAAGQIATTSLETGNDTGNYAGVAIYSQNGEAVLVTEMEAGWYRYIMEWRFGLDGTIRPRFGFGGTQNNCVCFTHHHHVYWRFDFDVVSPTNRVFQLERGRKFMQPILTEINRDKRIQTNRRLLIQNSTGDEGYMVVPNIFDGNVDAFGVNDFWVLRYKNVVGGTPVQNEIDDGTFAGDPNPIIKINQFVNGESVVNQDVVVWYGAHFLHHDGNNVINSQRSPKVLSGDHVVGPDLRPVLW